VSDRSEVPTQRGSARSSATEAEAPSRVGIGDTGSLQRVVCGVFAWIVTVAPVVTSPLASPLGRAAGAFALVAAIAGPLLVPRSRRLGRHVGITGLLGLSLVAWAMSAATLAALRLDFVRSFVGSVAWGAYAFSWGEPWRRPAEPSDVHEAPLRARSQLAPFAVPVAAIGVVGAVLLLAAAWRVREDGRGALAHVVAAAMALGLVSIAADVAIERSRTRRPSLGLSPDAMRALIALAIAAGAGAAFLVVRG
jgi:hypothetical protein